MTEELIQSEYIDTLEIDTGDIVLFNRPCSQMSFFGALICFSTKMLAQSSWDHIGVVLKDESGDLFLLEAGIKGVVVHPLIERLKRSKSKDIALRKLLVDRSPDLQMEAWNFGVKVKDTPYEQNIWTLLKSGLKPFIKFKRHRLYAMLKRYEREILEIEGELIDEGNQLTHFQTKTLELERERKIMQKNMLLQTLDSSPSFFENETDLSKFFCSELVAALYQHLGILDDFPPPNDFSPADFSLQKSEQVFKGQLAFGTEIFIKRQGGISKVHREVDLSGADEILSQALLSSKFAFKDPCEFMLKRYTSGQILPPARVFVMKHGTINFGKPQRTLGMITEGMVFDTVSSSICICQENCLVWESCISDGDLNLLNEPKTDLLFLSSALKQHHIFHKKIENDLQEACKRVYPLHFAKGDHIFDQGTVAEHFFILQNGKCSVKVQNGSSQPLSKVGVLSTGDTFGDTALLFGTKRGASVVAETDVALYAMSKFDFLNLTSTGSKYLNKALRRQFALARHLESPYPRHHILEHLRDSGVSQKGIDVACFLLPGEIVNFAQIIELDLMLSKTTDPIDVVFKAMDSDHDGYVTVGDVDNFLEKIHCDAKIVCDRMLGPLSLSTFKEIANKCDIPSVSLLVEEVDNFLRIWKTAYMGESLAVDELSSEIERDIRPLDLENIMHSSHLISSGIAAGIARTLVCPLERLKILHQVAPLSFSVSQTFFSMWRGGQMQGLFRGNSLNLARSFICFTLQGCIIKQTSESLGQKALSLTDLILIGGSAGVLANIVTQPIDVVRVHMAAQTDKRRWTGMWQTIKASSQKDRSFLLRGMLPMSLYIFLYIGLDMQFFQSLKLSLDLTSVPSYDFILFGTMAMASAQTIAYPFDLVRRRMQLSFPPQGAINTARDILRTSGLRGFYRGASLNWLKAFPTILAGVFVMQKLEGTT